MRLVPTKVSFWGFNLSDLKVKFVSAGSDHTVVLDFNNNVWVNLKKPYRMGV
jgi:hypothetical protein